MCLNHKLWTESRQILSLHNYDVHGQSTCFVNGKHLGFLLYLLKSKLSEILLNESALEIKVRAKYIHSPFLL